MMTAGLNRKVQDTLPVSIVILVELIDFLHDYADGLFQHCGSAHVQCDG